MAGSSPVNPAPLRIHLSYLQYQLARRGIADVRLERQGYAMIATGTVNHPRQRYVLRFILKEILPGMKLIDRTSLVNVAQRKVAQVARR